MFLILLHNIFLYGTILCSFAGFTLIFGCRLFTCFKTTAAAPQFVLRLSAMVSFVSGITGRVSFKDTASDYGLCAFLNGLSALMPY